MGRRTVLLIAAFVVAALGTTLVYLYVSSVDDRALANQKPVEVLVAKNNISAGTSVSDAAAAGSFELKTIASSSVVSTAVSTVDPLKGMVALSTVYAGEQILPAQFGSPAAVMALPIPDGKIAVSVQLADPARVAGFVQPGSEVAVFVTLAQTAGQTTTRLLLPTATVIAVGPTTLTPVTAGAPGTNTEALPRAILTLALDQRSAEKIVFASQAGQVSFGLRTEKSKIAPGPGTNLGNLFQ